MDGYGVEVGVGELVALVNQTFEYAYPEVTVTGELANLRVSKGKWIYFDLKDESASVKFFGTVYMLPGPLEDGMLLKVRATPRLHNLYGFSMNVHSMQPAGEGSIRKAADLLQRKLTAEGLFEEARKRPLPYPPQHIGLIASRQSAAYADFIKILDARWGGVSVTHIDVQVQGEPAIGQICAAVDQCNALAEPPEVLVLIRGGGSPEDLAAFSSEQVTRAVATSRVPTLVAIGHEIDVSLAELAADRRASTPSNAAEFLVPDRQAVIAALADDRKQLNYLLKQQLVDQRAKVGHAVERLQLGWQQLLNTQTQQLRLQRQVLSAYDPSAALQRGYAILRDQSTLLTKASQLKMGQQIIIELADGQAQATIDSVDEAR